MRLSHTYLSVTHNARSSLDDAPLSNFKTKEHAYKVEGLLQYA
jgi:hypothetical protein